MTDAAASAPAAGARWLRVPAWACVIAVGTALLDRWLWLGEGVAVWGHLLIVPILVLAALLRRDRLHAGLLLTCLAALAWPRLAEAWAPRATPPPADAPQTLRVALADLTNWSGDRPVLVRDLAGLPAEVLVLRLGPSPALIDHLRDLGRLLVTQDHRPGGTYLVILARGTAALAGRPLVHAFPAEVPGLLMEVPLAVSGRELSLLTACPPEAGDYPAWRRDRLLRARIIQAMQSPMAAALVAPGGWPATSARWSDLAQETRWTRPAGAAPRTAPAWLPAWLRPACGQALTVPGVRSAWAAPRQAGGVPVAILHLAPRP